MLQNNVSKDRSLRPVT